MKSLKVFLSFLVCSIYLIGCASSSVLTAKKTGSQAIGHYAIPKALIKVNVELKYPEAALGSAAALTPGSVSMSVPSVETELIPAGYIPIYYDPSPLSSDGITVDVDEHGYLTSVAIDVDDKTPAFVAALVDIAKLGVTLDKYPATVLAITNGIVKQEFHFYVDPYSGATQTLDPIPGVTGDEIDVSVASHTASSGGTSPNPSISSCAGKICYPALVAKTLSLSGPVGTKEQRVVVVPDPRQLFEVDFKRAAAVQKTVTAEFSDGILSKVVLNKPSEALSITSIPIDILTEIISIPSELVQLKIDTSGKEKDLVNAQKELLKAQESLLEAVETAKEAAATREDGQGDFGS